MTEPELTSIPRKDLSARLDLVRSLLEGSPEGRESFETYLTEEEVHGKIENFVGAVPVPLGLAGPIHISGQYAKGLFIVPMATLEGTLVASYSRGARVMNESGGCETLVYGDSFLRAAQFTTRSLADSALLISWCKREEQELRQIAEGTSGHLSVIEFSYDCVGSTVCLTVRAETG